ncbi:probable histone H2AXb [Triticum urartu]|uniref:probable histone H2AXb n=1 Tax=Triticum urartu TaxID=4572 RepID=UPI00204416A0|nr:probable histone H2AXb [Triticum urartu]
MAIADSGRGKSKPAASTKSVSRSSMAGLQIPVSRITRYLRGGNYAQYISTGALVYLVTEVDIPPAPPLLVSLFSARTVPRGPRSHHFISFSLIQTLEPAGNTTRDNKKNRIVPRHIQPAMCNDEELSRLLCAFTIAADGLMPDIHTVLLPKKADKAKDDIHRQAS